MCEQDNSLDSNCKIKELVESQKQYEEEVKSLKAIIVNLESQIKDLKNFILNQKNLHAKEIEDYKKQLRKKAQEKVGGVNSQDTFMKSQIHSQYNNPSCKNSSFQDINPEILTTIKQNIDNSLIQILKNQTVKYLTKFEWLSKGLINFQKKIKIISKKLQKKNALIQYLNEQIQFKNRHIQKQKKFIESITNQTKESQEFHKMQLDFIQSLYSEKKSTCIDLQKKNIELYKDYITSIQKNNPLLLKNKSPLYYYSNSKETHSPIKKKQKSVKKQHKLNHSRSNACLSDAQPQYIRSTYYILNKIDPEHTTEGEASRFRSGLSQDIFENTNKFGMMRKKQTIKKKVGSINSKSKKKDVNSKKV